MEIYVVNEGDTLQGIAALYGVSSSRLAYDNEVLRGEIVPGQALIIVRPEVVYTVKDGDTLTDIAEGFGISVNQILRNNSYLLNESFLVTGRELVIRYYDDDNQPLVSGLNENDTAPLTGGNSSSEQAVIRSETDIDIYGYAYPFIREDILEEASLYIDELLPFSYGFNEDGTLIYLNDDSLIDNALRFDNRLRMVITPLDRNGRFNNQQVVNLLSDEEVQDVLIDNIIEVMNDKGYMALDIDFEFIPGEFREEYVVFVAKTRERLNELGYQVSVALPPKTSSDQPGLLYEGIDYAGLGNAADSVFLMTYEWGYKYGPPLAVAPIPSVRRVLDYAVSEIPVDKIYMGIPNYAYDWPLPYERGVTVAETIGNTEAVRRAYEYGTEILYDEESEAPYYYYTDENGIEHVVWFEDVRSIIAKYDLVREYGFRGAGYWNLMREFRPNWVYVNQVT
ncbi:MAG: LysM peptidoglycan-binding domain-containing protein [Lachnospiraceae bacterium]|nr:LysM peptidoglycan-binding domain-containing protein [Lachnospiraceae bacterium]